MQLNKTFIDCRWEVRQLFEQSYLDSQPYSMDYVLILFLSFPEEGITAILLVYEALISLVSLVAAMSVTGKFSSN